MSLYKTFSTLWSMFPEGARRLVRRSRTLDSMKNRMRMFAMARAPHDEVYDASFFRWAEEAAVSSAPGMAGSIVEVFHPASVLDVGCGSGDLLAELRRHGVRAFGVEYAEAGLNACRARGIEVIKHDLRSAATQTIPSADVVVSLEVAEHLPEICADRYVDVLCRHGRSVVFTAASPGQGGVNHFNEQPPEYWIDIFRRHGFFPDEPALAAMRGAWRDRDIAPVYRRNLMVFSRLD